VTYNGGAEQTQITGGAGQINWINSSSNPAGDVAFTGSFSTYCIDLLQDINFGNTYTYDVKPLASGAPQPGAYLANSGIGSPMGSVRAADITKLYDLHYAQTLGGVSDNTNRTAFQLAIWNLVYDNSNNGPDASVSNLSGNFFVPNVSGNAIAQNGPEITTANAWLADVLNPNIADVQKYNVGALVGENGAQDQIYASTITNQGAAPLPQSLLGGLVLLGVCAAIRWRGGRPQTDQAAASMCACLCGDPAGPAAARSIIASNAANALAIGSCL
jgi:hypothetical protein